MSNFSMERKIDLYWQGKPKRVRNAVEEYLIFLSDDFKFVSKIRPSQMEIALKHGITENTIRANIKRLENRGLLRYYINRNTLKFELGKCIKCENKLFVDSSNKYKISDTRNKLIGYLCKDCFGNFL